ncbi:podocan-like protein 1 [Anopheles albimanus]|uniref:podocan-like protein 1 n=1 Tax=Anopheles albimanus TaxID=7167 RepID=UPI001641C2FF|nr:podocan-like protein 1 [Anopheles albimanus]
MSRIGVIVLSALVCSLFLVGLASPVEAFDNQVKPKTMTVDYLIAEWHSLHLEQNRFVQYQRCISVNVHLTESEPIPLGYFAGDERTKGEACVVFENSTMGRLPKELLPSFPNATTLVLEYLQMRTIERGAFDSGEKVEELNLGHNDITHLEPGVFSGLRVLRVLSLEYNQISRLAPGLFALNAKLEMVYINSNQLTSIEDNTFSNISKVVHLSNNHIERLDFGQFSRVTILDASFNRLTEFVANGVNQMLQELSLRSNKLTNVAWLAMFRALREIDLAYNEIREVLPEYFPAEIPLKNLLLNNNRLITFDINPAHLRHLRWLELSNNLLTSVDLSSSLLDDLDLIYLRNNSMQTLLVSPSNRLSVASLYSNDWDCATLPTQLAAIDPASISGDEPPCKAGYVMESKLCCKKA